MIALESEQEEAFNYGMHFFCPKPVSLELLTIVLAAKREYEVNEEAVDRICSLINANGDEHPNNSNPSNNDPNIAPTIVNNIGLSPNQPVPPQANQNISNTHPDEKNKWVLFRNKKGKVHPDTGN